MIKKLYLRVLVCNLISSFWLNAAMPSVVQVGTSTHDGYLATLDGSSNVEKITLRDGSKYLIKQCSAPLDQLFVREYFSTIVPIGIKLNPVDLDRMMIIRVKRSVDSKYVGYVVDVDDRALAEIRARNTELDLSQIDQLDSIKSIHQLTKNLTPTTKGLIELSTNPIILFVEGTVYVTFSNHGFYAMKKSDELESFMPFLKHKDVSRRVDSIYFGQLNQLRMSRLISVLTQEHKHLISYKNFCFGDIKPNAEVRRLINCLVRFQVDRLFFCNCQFALRDLRLIFPGLKKLKKLANLALISCGLDGDKVKIIINSLHSQLERLDLSRNPIGEAAVDIVSKVETIYTMRELVLNNIELDSKDHIKATVNLLKDTPGFILYIKGNITDRDALWVELSAILAGKTCRVYT